MYSTPEGEQQSNQSNPPSLPRSAYDNSIIAVPASTPVGSKPEPYKTILTSSYFIKKTRRNMSRVSQEEDTEF
jgi:hypothetical protein